ncbi:hypothetical protein K2224_35295 (plasmid) [Streptomyces sp. BHT-5-2]|uniref:hypothetical protein n=1 Tax=Streptomyces sp. BHT-5-2 TaxID=2866715 RepID=UPI001C8D310D|nr:hypothetical protein [Streptomyces sp. BHT-5-2]QZL08374.1 hypothetical protein K2224_35295 [Streptomyces sp. BHT-5-2]
MSLCSQPRHPVSRLTQAGGDARALLATVATDAPNRIAVPALEALRQILVQQLTVAVRGRLRPRTGKDGFPPGSLQIRSPYDLDTCATFDDMEG